MYYVPTSLDVGQVNMSAATPLSPDSNPVVLVVLALIKAVLEQGPLGIVLVLGLVALILGLVALLIWGLVKVINCPNTPRLIGLVLRAFGLIGDSEEPEGRRGKKCKCGHGRKTHK